MAIFLVTGSAGFIGLNTLEFLSSKGHIVIGVDNYVTASRQTSVPVLAYLEKHREVCTYRIDLEKDYFDLMAIFEKYPIDYIIHLAAIPSVTRSVENPIQTSRNNVVATLNILDLASKYKVKKFVYAGSSSYYGGNLYSAANTSTKPPNCKSPYAASKAAGELFTNAYFHTFGLPTTILRYFNVFGKYQNPDSLYSAVIPCFISKILKNEQPIIYGSGLQTRDFTYVENVVNASHLAATSEISGKTYDVGCGTNTNLIDLLNIINELTSKNIKPIFKEVRQGDVMNSCANLNNIKHDLNYTPSVDLRSGLEKTLFYYKEEVIKA